MQAIYAEESKLPGTNVSSRWELITPEVAADYLGENHERNRRRYKGLVSRYANDMLLGEWEVTHQGIAFDLNGRVVDGQHRLESVVDSKTSQWFLVTRGLSERAILLVDRGKSRTIADNMHIMGRAVVAEFVSVARVMLCAPEVHRGNRLSMTEIRRGLEKYSSLILEAHGMFPKKAGPAPFRACVAKAMHHADVGQLQRFGLAVMDKIPLSETTEVDQMVRRKMPELRRLGAATVTRTIAYKKFQRLLLAYLSNEVLVNLYEANDDLFPLKDA